MNSDIYVRYSKKYERLSGTVLKVGNTYRARYIGRYWYDIYSRNYEVKLCTITSKTLNHFFEKVEI